MIQKLKTDTELAVQDGAEIEVSVSHYHITEGARRCGLYCAVAMALNDQYPSADIPSSLTRWSVGVRGASGVIAPHKLALLDFPPNVQAWILDFDAGKKVSPLKFKAKVRIDHVNTPEH